MKNLIKTLIPLTVLLTLTSCSSAPSRPGAQAHFTETVDANIFFKGNLHAHTNESDGKASPDSVIKWFKSHGYRFLAITDHDKLTINHKFDDREFVTLNGVELTGTADTKKPVHLNAICGNTPLKGIHENRPPAAVLKDMIARSNKDGAITLVNHPNYFWALTTADLLANDGFELLEIASSSPLANETGDASHPSEEELWDRYQTQKHRVFGAAIDDSHDDSTAGKAWVAVWAQELTQAAICDGIRRGHFYSARGTRLSALKVTDRTMQLAVDHWNSDTDHVDFIGASGQLLERTTSSPARYNLRGGEGYVRAHVHQAEKHEAWTQAYFIKYD